MTSSRKERRQDRQLKRQANTFGWRASKEQGAAVAALEARKQTKLMQEALASNAAAAHNPPAGWYATKDGAEWAYQGRGRVGLLERRRLDRRQEREVKRDGFLWIGVAYALIAGIGILVVAVSWVLLLGGVL